VRAAGAILEPGQTLALVAAPPDVGPVTGDPHGVGRVSDGPAPFDPLAEQQSTCRSQTSVTVHREHGWTLSARSMGTTARRQVAIHRCPAHAEGLGDLHHGEITLLVELSGPGDLRRRHHGGPAAVAAPSPGSCQPSQGALADEVSFELGQRSEEVEDQASAGAGGVDPLVEAAEADAPLLEGGDDVDEVPQGTRPAGRVSKRRGCRPSGGGRGPGPAAVARPGRRWRAPRRSGGSRRR
jgi:hypothetical protein